MRKGKLSRVSLAIAIFASMVLVVSAASAKVGRKGQISLSEPATAGAMVLEPGTYAVQHQAQGDSHVMVFWRLNENGYRASSEPVKVKCRLEPLSEEVRQTSVTSSLTSTGARALSEVDIRGENVRHVF